MLSVFQKEAKWLICGSQESVGYDRGGAGAVGFMKEGSRVAFVVRNRGFSRL